MIRLIAVIIIFAFFLVFIVFNLPNKCDISFGFKTFADVPVFVTALFSFVLGMLCTIPLILGIGKKHKKPAKSDESPSLLSGVKKRWGKKNKKSPEDTGVINDINPVGSEQFKKENTPYGID